jgi:hypothetical protein
MRYFSWLGAVLNGPSRSIPNLMKGHGIVIELSSEGERCVRLCGFGTLRTSLRIPWRPGPLMASSNPLSGFS